MKTMIYPPRKGMQKKEDRPVQGKIYALTGAPGTPSIQNGNTWPESEVKEPKMTDKVCVNCGTLIDENGRCGGGED